jgi:short subunit dehydrogenase-like uncharacterized protein
MPGDRAYDVVLFGASGFTGKLTAEYLARKAPAGTRWALAGRNPAKLEALRGRLATINPACEGLAVLSADVTDPDSLRAVAEAAKVVITTVGPYAEHGEPLVAACAEAGTDYVDLTGEADFVDRMYLAHHARAVETGARIVHACGFDSIPHDLGVYFTVQQLPEGVPLAIDGYVRASATFSGGTFDTALRGFGNAGNMVRAAKERARAEARAGAHSPKRKVRTPLGAPHRVRDSGLWAVPLPTVDPQIVGRSAWTLDRYGPDFTYRHFGAVKHLPTIVAGAAGLGAVFAAAQIPPLRRALSGLRKPGDGPDEQKRAQSWFTVTFHGEGGGHRVRTRVSGGDPGYTETSKMLAESALCLAHDDLPPTSGQVTTAAAMGDALLGRLVDAGLDFTVLDS